MGKIIKGLAAGATCVAMQIPYGLSGDSEKAGAFGSVLCDLAPSADMEFTGYDDHWWWDNVAHFFGGYAVGTALSLVLRDEERVLKAFLVLTGAWEVFEYATHERPWHVDESGEMLWEFDHAMEDTALDTIVGAAGAYVAAKE